MGGGKKGERKEKREEKGREEGREVCSYYFPGSTKKITVTIFPAEYTSLRMLRF